MQICDIIVEAPNKQQPIRPSNISKRQWKAMSPAQRQSIVRAGSTPTVPSSTPAPATNTPVQRKPKANTLKNKLNRIQAYVRGSRQALNTAETKYDRVFGSPFKWLFRFAGLTAAIIELYASLDAIDEDYRSGTGMIQTESDYNALRELAFGTFQTAMLAPIVAQLCIRLAKTVLFINWIKRIGALASAPITAGLSVGAMLATEFGIAWFQKWIVSKEGQDWVADSFFMTPIRTFGKFGNNIADAISMAYTKATTGTAQTNLDRLQAEPVKPTKPGNDSRQNQSSQAGQGGQAEPGQAPPAAPSTAAYTTDIRNKVGNIIFVGRVPVTDEKGYLDIDTIDMISVRAARQAAIRRGQPDPIEGIPQRPGDPKVEIMKPLQSPEQAPAS